MLSARQLLQRFTDGRTTAGVKAADRLCQRRLNHPMPQVATSNLDSIESFTGRRQLRRQVQGIAAALLPYKSTGEVAIEAFQAHLRATQQAGLMNAVNMDTG